MYESYDSGDDGAKEYGYSHGVDQRRYEDRAGRGQGYGYGYAPRQKGNHAGYADAYGYDGATDQHGSTAMGQQVALREGRPVSRRLSESVMGSTFDRARSDC